jgi:UDP-N-acetylmuramoyl-tripeptide--D-alanyl-D-alanine ligase
MKNARGFFANILLWYFRTAAKIQLGKAKPLVIGVGGSAGKTSLVSALRAAIGSHKRVRSGEGINSQTGLPLGVLGLRLRDYTFAGWARAAFQALGIMLADWRKYDIYLAEYGLEGPESPRNMEYLIGVLRPDVGILTNITWEHSENFEAPGLSREQVFERIAGQEELLLTTIPQSGTAVVNLDDPRIVAARPRIRAKQVTASTTNPEADFSVRTFTLYLDRFYMQIAYRGKPYDLRLPRPLSQAYVSTLLLAIAGAHTAGVGITETFQGITENWQLPAGRLNVLRGVQESVLIDSSYNATPVAMRDALAFLRDASDGRHRVAILGDMRELGKTGEQEHRDLAPLVRAAADHAILIGPQMKELVAPELQKLGMQFETFDTFTAAREAIQQAVQPKSVVLIKGSQNTLFLERAVELLLADKNDVAKLCRRGPHWDAERAKTP